MQLELINFTKRFGDTTVIQDITLKEHSGEMIALLCPSGCGKSTILFAICGIHRIDGGQLLSGGEDVTRKPSQERNVGVVFQNYALYPQMSIFDNIAFPLKMQKKQNGEIKREVGAIAEMVHISELQDRRPKQLSDGQQQRMALALALVRKPDFLLLDEPLANLDANLRPEMRSEIRRLQQDTGITAILVTDDQVGAMSMCDRIAIMTAGNIVQFDAPKVMHQDPRDRFVESFLGNPPISFVAASELEGDFASAREVGVRPEHFGPQYGRGTRGKVILVETQGREELFDVRLASGAMLGSIQPAGRQVALGEAVGWGLNRPCLLALDGSGDRI